MSGMAHFFPLFSLYLPGIDHFSLQASRPSLFDPRDLQPFHAGEFFHDYTCFYYQAPNPLTSSHVFYPFTQFASRCDVFDLGFLLFFKLEC